MADMTYSESAQGQMITGRRVIAELAAHGFDTMQDRAECFDAIPSYETGVEGLRLYNAGDVLRWLGY